MSGSLTFVIPVRHYDSVSDWNGVCDRLEITLHSIAAQTSDNWQCIVVANRGSSLPPLPAQVSVEWVDLPLTILPSPAQDREAYHHAIRLEKGNRVLAGMMAAPRDGFAMVVDYDDLVSRHLAELVKNNPQANGWYFDSGWIFDGSRVIFRQSKHFNHLCGTSHLIRTDLYQLPDRIEDASPDYIRRYMGSHRFIAEDLAARGAPLEPLPLTGAIYRIGYRGNTSGNSTILKQRILRRGNLNPRELWRTVSNLSLLDNEIQRNYFAGGPAR